MLTRLAAAVAAARRPIALDEISRLTWRALSEGVLAEADADAISRAVEARRRDLAGSKARGALSAPQPVSGLRRPVRPVSPDRAASVARRRRMAASGQLPPQIAAQFTVAEQAVLAVVARIARRAEVVVEPLDKLAALAGVCRSSVKNALRAAEKLGLIRVTIRRREGRRNDLNRIGIIAPAWQAWLRIGVSGGRGQRLDRHDYQMNSSACEKRGNPPLTLEFPIRSGPSQSSQDRERRWKPKTLSYFRSLKPQKP